jgi:hippurate hydrolase
VPVQNRIAGYAQEMTEWRRDLHAHPELAFEEHRTSDRVAELLQGWGLEVTRGIAGTGLVGTLRQGHSTRSIGLRADMDALPMQEATGLPYQSEASNRMHACGHDGHTTMLLGAAKYLAETRNFDGIVHFIFQPAEENGGGGGVMVEEGLFDRFPCDMVFGAHNDPSLKLGMMTAIAGPVCANTDDFWIRIEGHGGHAAHPEVTLDPVLIGAHVVLALQSLASRRTSPTDPVVISICQFHAGSATNVIPDGAALNGTVRTLNPDTRALMQKLLSEVAIGTARAHGADAVVEYEPGYPGIINAAEPTSRAARAAERLLGEGHVIREQAPSLGGEDFAYMAQAVPGCFVRIGMADGARGSTGLHNPHYDFNDDALPIGASFWATLIEQELARG